MSVSFHSFQGFQVSSGAPSKLTYVGLEMGEPQQPACRVADVRMQFRIPTCRQLFWPVAVGPTGRMRSLRLETTSKRGTSPLSLFRKGARRSEQRKNHENSFNDP